MILIFHLLAPPSLSETQKLKIVASFSILGDVVGQILKDKGTVSTIVAANSDAHTYEPKPQDVKQIAHSDLVFINGRGFEGWMPRLIEASGYKGKIIETSKGAPQRYGKCAHNNQEDPHVWHSIPHVLVYVENIEKALSEKDPENRAFYKKNADDYRKTLLDLDATIKKEIAQIPPKHRRIITAHDAFGYFGDTYGVQFFSPVGMSTESEPLMRDVGRIFHKIREHGVKTIFVENITSPRLIEIIASETGVKVGPLLYSDALSDPKGPASTYLDMMRYNTKHFIASMKEIGDTFSQ